MVSLNCAHLCLMHLAPYTALFIIVIIFFAMGGQLRWALCLSGNPPLCLVAVVYICYIYFVVLWKIKPSLSLSANDDSKARRHAQCTHIANRLYSGSARKFHFSEGLGDKTPKWV